MKRKLRLHKTEDYNCNWGSGPEPGALEVFCLGLMHWEELRTQSPIRSSSNYQSTLVHLRR